MLDRLRCFAPAEVIYFDSSAKGARSARRLSRGWCAEKCAPFTLVLVCTSVQTATSRYLSLSRASKFLGRASFAPSPLAARASAYANLAFADDGSRNSSLHPPQEALGISTLAQGSRERAQSPLCAIPHSDFRIPHSYKFVLKNK